MVNFANNSPYFDNANNEIHKDYVSLLFRPGYALQARELTQLQSLLQYQVSQVGDFLFKNGSPVQGGHITFDNSVTSLKLQANDNITLSDFEGKLIINSTGAVTTRAVVIAVDDSISSNTVEGALIVKYLSGNKFSDGDTIKIATGAQETATLAASSSNSRASLASINEGVFYADGYFVFVEQQNVVLDSSNPLPSYRVGLQINASIVDESQDATLLDPAQGSFNYQAPGANRYKYQLELAKRLLNSTDDSRFFELLRIENGVVTNQIESPILGNIENSLAERTFDESGNYTVTPFIASTIDDPSNTSNFIVSVGAGKAYVQGYGFETIAPVKMNNDKARSTNSSVDHIMSMQFGNYLSVTNVYSGNVSGFNTGNFGQLDLHLIPSANINTTSSGAYANTKLGTARVRDIEYSGTNQWLAYLLDINLQPIVVNAAGVSANTGAVTLPATFTASVNAIANVTMTVLAGNSSGDVRTIVSYNAATKVGVLDRATTQLLDTTSQLSLQFGTKDINSLVATPVFTGNAFGTQNTTSAKYPCMDISVNGGKDVLGNTVLFNTNLNRLDFALPQSFIAQNSFSNVTFMNRKTLTSVSFTSGNTTIGTGSGLDNNELYTFGFTAAYVPDSVSKANFLVVVRDKQTSNLANGQVLIWDQGLVPAGNGVYQTDSTHVTIKTVTTGNFVADVLLTVQDHDASVNFRRSKTLTGNTSNTLLLSTDSYLNGTAVVGTANTNSVYIDAANGHVWFTKWNDIVKTPGTPMSLCLPDVVQIVKIYDSGNTALKPNVTNSIDVTSHYLFDSGQRDNYYDHASIILRDGFNPPRGQTVVMLQYYSHDATSGFFSADSYSANNYANGIIPVYASEKFGAVQLRDVIDFRPTRTVGTTANVQGFTLNGLRLPQPDNSMILSYNFYLPRIDKLVLTRDRQFKILQGTPALQPQVPVDMADGMTLYTMTVPPYTYVAANVSLSYIENKRYTMRDIGALDNRISQLEFYTSLNQLENNALQQSVLYQDGITAKETFGVVTDSFDDFSVADPQNPDLFCSIKNGNLEAYQMATPIEFLFNGATGPYQVNDRTYSLAYSEIPAITQNTASDFTQIQPYAFGMFNGEVSLRPQTDYWYSNDLMPQIIAPPQKPVEPPPSPPPAPVVPPSTVGVTTDLNSANLVPATTTTTPPAATPPVAGTPAPAANTDFTYCYPVNSWYYNYNSYAYTYGLTNNYYGLGYAYYGPFGYYGGLCVTVRKSPTGYGYIGYQGQWYPLQATQYDSLVKYSSQTVAAKPLAVTTTGSATRMLIR